MRVIAMSCENEPLDRVATGQKGKLVYISKAETNSEKLIEPLSGVGFPADAVFEYDGQLLDSLRRAWERKDEAELDRLWAGAKPLLLEASALYEAA